MTELKKLKDLEWKAEMSKAAPHVHTEVLKQEAIKWVNFGKELIAFEHKKENEAFINFIKHFFNLTEEDLK